MFHRKEIFLPSMFIGAILVSWEICSFETWAVCGPIELQYFTIPSRKVSKVRESTNGLRDRRFRPRCFGPLEEIGPVSRYGYRPPWVTLRRLLHITPLSKIACAEKSDQQIHCICWSFNKVLLYLTSFGDYILSTELTVRRFNVLTSVS